MYCIHEISHAKPGQNQTKPNQTWVNHGLSKPCISVGVGDECYSDKAEASNYPVGAIRNVSSNYKRRRSGFSPFLFHSKALGIRSRHFFYVYLILSRLKAAGLFDDRMRLWSNSIGKCAKSMVSGHRWITTAARIDSFELWPRVSRIRALTVK